MAEAVAGSTWQTEIPLVSQSNTHAFQSAPTIASGDWKKTTVTSGGTVSTLSNLDNLPTVDPAGSVQVKIILSAAETTAAGAGGHINIIGIDASGAEWDPIFIRVDVEAATTNGRASDIQARIPAALVSGRIDASVGAIANNAITAAAIAADAITDAKVASDVTIAAVTGAVGSVTAGVSLADGAITAAKFGAGAITASVIATDAIDADSLAADAVTELQSGLATSTALTTLSNKVGTPAGASVSADIAAVKAETASIQTDTNDLQTQIGTAGAGLTAVASAANLATLTGYVDTEVAAIKAKTDNLPASPANESTLSTVATNVAAILADTGTDGVVLSTAQMQALADIVLGRSVANIDNTAATHSLYELIQAILEGNTSTGSWVIYKTNGSTTFNTRTLATDVGAVPIVGVS